MTVFYESPLNFLNVSSLRSLELENQKTENEDKGFHRSSKNENVRDEHRLAELNRMFNEA